MPSCVFLVPTFINKTLMVLLLCLIFIGQSMASMTMFYKMTSMQSMSNVSDISSMTSSHHNMSNMTDCNEEMMTTASTTTTEECCTQECDCLTSGCSTISAFSAVMHYTPDIAISSKIVSSSALVTSQALTSLYRPPILS